MSVTGAAVPWRLATLPEIGLRAFCSGAEDPSGLERWMGLVLESGSVRQEWCFAALDASGDCLAAHCWWARPGSDRPVGVDQLWSRRHEAAVAILEAARRRLRPDDVRAEVTSPIGAGPSARATQPETVAILTAAGFDFDVARVRLEWTGGKAATVPRRLEMRPARLLDEATLVTLFQAVAEGSLDAAMRERREHLGAEGEARQRLDDVRSYAGDPEWFSVGFTSAGEPAGYVVPGYVDGTAVVVEIGVGAGHRGRRFVDELLSFATTCLSAAGATRIVADTDCANVPMRAAFRRGGYAEFRWRDDYRWTG